MTDKVMIVINVDTFADGAAYFVRTEIDAHYVTIHGPFPDQQTAQKLKADQVASRETMSETLSKHIEHAASSLPAAG
jgi:hypothetical protein